ncbi:MAG TPA: FadR/GntR family transcriptional regulator [Bacillota bacterium]
MDERTGKKAFQEVVARLEALIKTGQVGFGEYLPPERELAGRFGVGRPAVREALKALEILGMVVIEHGKGARVTTPSLESWFQAIGTSLVLSPADFLHLMEARETLEPQLAFIAASRATAEQLQELGSSLTVMNRALEKVTEFAAADYRFHGLIAQATNNPVLIKIYEAIAGLLWLLQQETAVVPDRQKSYTYHEAIYRAVFERNPMVAREEMELHLKDTRERFLDFRPE